MTPLLCYGPWLAAVWCFITVEAYCDLARNIMTCRETVMLGEVSTTVRSLFLVDVDPTGCFSLAELRGNAPNLTFVSVLGQVSICSCLFGAPLPCNLIIEGCTQLAVQGTCLISTTHMTGASPPVHTSPTSQPAANTPQWSSVTPKVYNSEGLTVAEAAVVSVVTTILVIALLVTCIVLLVYILRKRARWTRRLQNETTREQLADASAFAPVDTSTPLRAPVVPRLGKRPELPAIAHVTEEIQGEQVVIAQIEHREPHGETKAVGTTPQASMIQECQQQAFAVNADPSPPKREQPEANEQTDTEMKEKNKKPTEDARRKRADGSLRPNPTPVRY